MIDMADSWLPALTAAFGVIAMAMIGGWLTDIGPWYSALRFPPWKPPNWAFGPIWTVILLFAGVGIVLGWMATPGGGPRLVFAGLLLLNGVLNVLWNYLFFTMKRPDFALAGVVALWLSILAILGFAAMHSTTAALCFAPYLIWVGIAGLLNWSIVRLNAPF